MSGLFDDLLGRETGPQEPDVSALVQKAVAAIDSGAKQGRTFTCSDCEKDRDRAIAGGHDVPGVAEAEYRVSQGRRIYAATCAYHTDLEWARLWQAKYDAADEPEKKRLLELANARTRSGRKVPATMPKGAAATTNANGHAAGCRCKDCTPVAP
jgi:hypothetical protein